jgi:hypothetical protein
MKVSSRVNRSGILSVVTVFLIFLSADFSHVFAQADIDTYITAAAQKLDPQVAAAIGNIDGTPRRLLALRGYLRSRAGLKSKWSWSAEEIARYKKSAEYKAALAEVERVKTKFAEQNPGHSIEVNTEVRTLEAQIASWNRTPSVGTAADALYAAARQELANPAYKAQPDDAGLRRFQNFLSNQNLSVAPTVATPGLSPHGQLRAFDFKIKKGNQIVATTDASTIETVWDAQGWTRKLNAAVTSASRKFAGPLAAPREPWHYAYVP